MLKLATVFIMLLLFYVNAGGGELLVQDDSAKAAQPADRLSQPQDVNNPENTLPTEQQQKSPQRESFEKDWTPARPLDSCSSGPITCQRPSS